MPAKRDKTRALEEAELDEGWRQAAAALDTTPEPNARRQCLGSRPGQQPPQGRREAEAEGGSPSASLTEALYGSGAGAPSTATAAAPPPQKGSADNGAKRDEKMRNERRLKADVEALPANRETLLKSDPLRRRRDNEEADRELARVQLQLYESVLHCHECCAGDSLWRVSTSCLPGDIRDGNHPYLKPAMDAKGRVVKDVVVYHSLTSAGFLDVPTVHCSKCKKNVKASPIAAGCFSSSTSANATKGYTRFFRTLTLESYRPARFGGYMSVQGVTLGHVGAQRLDGVWIINECVGEKSRSYA